MRTLSELFGDSQFQTNEYLPPSHPFPPSPTSPSDYTNDYSPIPTYD